MTLTKKQTEFVAAARKYMSVGPSEPLTLSRETIITIADDAGLNEPQWLTNHKTHRVARGAYAIPALEGKSVKSKVKAPAPSKAPKSEPAPVAAAPSPRVKSIDPMEVAMASLSPSGNGSLVPKKSATYVPFGCHAKVAKVVRETANRPDLWIPLYITGLSGNGKTTTVEQVCAELGREFIRVNITSSTDEDDLIGNFRLIDGSMVWVDGPVIVAMKRGAVLLLDEWDLGSEGKTMCLQPVMEGKPVFLKKTCTWVQPAQGFAVIATGNTKGRGDETGRFLHTNTQNEAALDRYARTYEQDYPPAAVEKKILKNHLSKLGLTAENDSGFADVLVLWANQNREAYRQGAIEDVITTRRLIAGISLYAVEQDRIEAVEGILTRFDVSTRQAMMDLYKKLDVVSDGGLNQEPAGEAPQVSQPLSNAPPF